MNEERMNVAVHPVVRVCEFRDGIEWFPAKFHGWTKIQRCPYGDGSAIEWVMHAVLEKPNGEVDYEEPHRIRFTYANASANPPTAGKQAGKLNQKNRL